MTDAPNKGIFRLRRKTLSLMVKMSLKYNNINLFCLKYDSFILKKSKSRKKAKCLGLYVEHRVSKKTMILLSL